MLLPHPPPRIYRRIGGTAYSVNYISSRNCSAIERYGKINYAKENISLTIEINVKHTARSCRFSSQKMK